MPLKPDMQNFAAACYHLVRRRRMRKLKSKNRESFDATLEDVAKATNIKRRRRLELLKFPIMSVPNCIG